MAVLRKVFTLLSFVALLLRECAALTWRLPKPGEKSKCFVEEVPEETLVVVSYEVLDWPKLDKAHIYYSFLDPFDQILNRGLITDQKGKVAFTSEHAGDHKVCFDVESETPNDSTVRMEIHIDAGEHAFDYERLAKVEHLSTIEVELRRLNDKINAIRNEQAFQKRREFQFRNTSEETNTKVVMWSVFQTVVLICCAMFQVYHLRSFFAAKKLV